MDNSADILRKIRQLEIKTRRLVDSAFTGHYHSVFKGRGMNFDEVREYQPGDEIRSIDWNVTARSGEAYIKKFKEERELSVMLVVDVSASGIYGSVDQSKRELAAEVACVLALSAVRNHDKVGLLLFSDDVELYLPPRKGRLHVLRLVREVMFHKTRGKGTDPGGAMHYLNRVLTRRAVVFLISDFEADSFERPLSMTARRHDVVAIPVNDPREDSLPDAGRVVLEDAETGEQMEVNTSDKAVRTAFEIMRARRFEELLTGLRKLRIDAIPLQTGGDYMPALKNFFRQRERRIARE